MPSATAGRFGRAGIHMYVNPSPDPLFLQKQVAPTDVDTAYVGVATRRTSYSTENVGLLTLLDGSSNQVWLRVDHTTGLLTLFRGGYGSNLGGGTQLAQSTGSIVQDVWYYIELGVTIHGSNGVYEVRVNGVPWIGPTSSANTQATGNASYNGVRIGGGVPGSNAQYQDFCDFYIVDGSGSRLNGFLGDLRGDPHYVTDDGANYDWTPLSGQNHEMVDEVDTFDGDTSYNSTTGIGDKDTFPVEDLKNTGATTVHAVQVLVAAEQVITGGSRIKALARVSGSDYQSTQEFAPSAGSYVWHNAIFEQNPDGTPAPWTEATVNGAEWGYEKTV